MRLLHILAFGCALSQAATIVPVSYEMLNGDTGSYNYWDESYTGSGNVVQDGDWLTGGLGDLTDGVVAPDNWFVTEAPFGAGPYVGWTIDPVIRFRFANVTSFGRVRIHFDDADGLGGVAAPAGAVINGASYSIPDPAGSAPFWTEFDVTGLSTDTLQIQLNSRDAWVFASEFTFGDTSAAAIPEPSTFAMLATGALVCGLFPRKRK